MSPLDQGAFASSYFIPFAHTAFPSRGKGFPGGQKGGRSVLQAHPSGPRSVSFTSHSIVAGGRLVSRRAVVPALPPGTTVSGGIVPGGSRRAGQVEGEGSHLPSPSQLRDSAHACPSSGVRMAGAQCREGNHFRVWFSVTSHLHPYIQGLVDLWPVQSPASALRREEDHWLWPELQACFLWDTGILCPDGPSWVRDEPPVCGCWLLSLSRPCFSPWPEKVLLTLKSQTCETNGLSQSLGDRIVLPCGRGCCHLLASLESSRIRGPPLPSTLPALLTVCPAGATSPLHRDGRDLAFLGHGLCSRTCSRALPGTPFLSPARGSASFLLLPLFSSSFLPLLLG